MNNNIKKNSFILILFYLFISGTLKPLLTASKLAGTAAVSNNLVFPAPLASPSKASLNS